MGVWACDLLCVSSAWVVLFIGLLSMGQTSWLVGVSVCMFVFLTFCIAIWAVLLPHSLMVVGPVGRVRRTGLNMQGTREPW